MGGVYTWGNISSIDLQWFLIKIPREEGEGARGGRHCLDINMRKYLHGHVLNGPHERRVEQSQDMYARRSLQSVGTPWPSHVAAKLATLQLN